MIIMRDNFYSMSYYRLLPRYRDDDVNVTISTDYAGKGGL